MVLDETLAVFGVVKDPTALALATTTAVTSRAKREMRQAPIRGGRGVKLTQP